MSGSPTAGLAGRRKDPLRLAYFSPLPPDRSGIVDYSRELLPALAQQAEITLFAEDPRTIGPGWDRNIALRPLADFLVTRADYDLAIYHVGNSPQHETIYKLALRYPGLVVLHDQAIHQFLAKIGGLDSACTAYVRDLGYVQGPRGMDLAWDVCYGQEPCPCFSLPLNDRLVDRSLGMIVHSHTVAASLREQRADRPVAVVPQLMPLHSGQNRRKMLGAGDNTLIFATIGQIANNRQLDLALRSFARLRQQFPDSLYLIVGQVAEDFDLDNLIAGLSLGDSVYRTGYVDGLTAFIDWTATADVIVNLRFPTVGETSAAALRALATGRPVIVFDFGWYSELPDTVSCKVKPLDEEGLLAAMLSLAEDRDRCQKMGQQAYQLIESEHDPVRCATLYLEAIERLFVEIDGKYR